MATKAKYILGSEPLKDKQRELFCQLYGGIASKMFFGNAAACYRYAYGGQEEIDAITLQLMDLEEPGEGVKKNKPEILRLEKRKKSIEMSANASGTRLLANVNIRQRVDYLFDQGLTDEMMDREMAFVIMQRGDLQSKVMAYDKVTKIKQRVSDKLSGELVVKWESDEEPDPVAETPTTTNKADKPKAKPKLTAKVKIETTSGVSEKEPDSPGIEWQED